MVYSNLCVSLIGVGLQCGSTLAKTRNTAQIVETHVCGRGLNSYTAAAPKSLSNTMLIFFRNPALGLIYCCHAAMLMEVLWRTYMYLSLILVADVLI